MRLQLRARLLLGYGYLLVLLLTSAFAATVGFQSLGGRITRLLDNDFAAIESTMHLLEALERQDSAVLAALLSDPDASEALGRSEALFEERLAELSRGNHPGDDDLLERIENTFAEYGEARTTLLRQRPERLLASYQENVQPLFDEVKDAVFALLQEYQEAIGSADREARRGATRSATFHGALVAIALLSLGLISRSLRRDLLDRLQDLVEVAEAVRSGDAFRRAREDSGDELATIAGAINRILDREQAQRARSNQRLQESLDLLGALVFEELEADALLDPSGERLISRLPRAAEETLEQRLPELLTHRDDDRLQLDGWTLERLGSGPRFVGWLARRRDQ